MQRSFVSNTGGYHRPDEYGEYLLMVHPVILGAGKYLFKDVSKMNLKLLETRTFRTHFSPFGQTGKSIQRSRINRPEKTQKNTAVTFHAIL